jgi:hypothetical protein
VWGAALHLVGGGLEGFALSAADEGRGVLQAHCAGALLKSPLDLRIKVGLDENGLTRVDAHAVPTGRAPTLGAGRRRIRAFMSALDANLGATPAQIIDPSRRPDYNR